MGNETRIDGNLFCCLSENLQTGDPKQIYQHQENLLKEKEGFRCSKCGGWYPFLQIRYNEQWIAPDALHNAKETICKHKKAAVFFYGDHYYAQSKKVLQKFERDETQQMQLTAEIPLRGEVCHLCLSQGERFLATETLQGAITVVDACSGEIAGRKTKCNANGAFGFMSEQELIYFSGGTIRCWNFRSRKETILWQFAEDVDIAGTVQCSTALVHAQERTAVFQCAAETGDFAVVIRDGKPGKIARLPEVPVLHRMVYMDALRRYTLPGTDRIYILDEAFQIEAELPCPELVKISDGGGCFPVTRFVDSAPQRAFLSPDGAWVLLDYFTTIVWMHRSTGALKGCRYSHTGQTATAMGFVDRTHCWYTWGNATFVQEMKA